MLLRLAARRTSKMPGASQLPHEVQKDAPQRCLFFKSKVLCLAIIALAWGTSRGQNENQKTGTVFGYVYNASTVDLHKDRDGEIKKASISGQEVVLHRYVNGQADKGTRAHTVTDNAGHFEFTGLDVGKRFDYYPVAVKDGLEYYGRMVKLVPDTTRAHSDVSVFDSTRSDSSIFLAMHHIIITPAPGVLNVKEVLTFANRGRTTYVGGAPAGPPNTSIVLQLDVPPGASELQYGGDLMKCCAVIHDGGIYDTMEFKPGTRNEVVTYRLPYDGQSAVIAKKTQHPTAALDIFLPENSGNLEAPGFSSEDGFQIRDQRFQRFSTLNAAAGASYTLMLSNLPPAPTDYRWLPPVVLTILVAMAVWFCYRRRSKMAGDTVSESGSSQDTPDNAVMQTLLNTILDLDEQYEAGSLDELTYLSERENLEAQVFALAEPDSGSGPDGQNSNREESNHENR